MSHKISIHNESEGFYSFRAGRIDSHGDEVDVYEPAPPTKNLITNGGLNRQGDNADWLRRIYVGSGSSTPNFNDTAMNNFVASTVTEQATSFGAQSTAPFFAWRRITRRFGAGAAAGNLSEVGIGWDAGLFSRALIRDAQGNPTTIAVGSDQFLDVTYEYRFYPKVTDDTGTITLSGSVGGVHDYIFRASSVTTVIESVGWFIDPFGYSMGRTSNSSTLGRSVWNGDIGTVTESPSGFSQNGIPITAAAYSENSLRRDFVVSLDLNTGNFGIRSALLRMGIGTFQIQFDQVIQKTSERLLSLTFSHSWGRRA